MVSETGYVIEVWTKADVTSEIIIITIITIIVMMITIIIIIRLSLCIKSFVIKCFDSQSG